MVRIVFLSFSSSPRIWCRFAFSPARFLSFVSLYSIYLSVYLSIYLCFFSLSPTPWQLFATIVLPPCVRRAVSPPPCVPSTHPPLDRGPRLLDFSLVAVRSFSPDYWLARIARQHPCESTTTFATWVVSPSRSLLSLTRVVSDRRIYSR